MVCFALLSVVISCAVNIQKVRLLVHHSCMTMQSELVKSAKKKHEITPQVTRKIVHAM